MGADRYGKSQGWRCDGVQRAAPAWRLEHAHSCNTAFDCNVRGRKVYFARAKKTIIISEATMDPRLHQVTNREAIRALIGLKVFEGRGRIEI